MRRLLHAAVHMERRATPLVAPQVRENRRAPQRRPAIFFLALSVFTIVASVAGQVALGQPYPSKPIRMIVPFPPGGTADILGRAIGQKLAENLGQPVVVENRPGANGNIGAQAVAKSPPDGYTLLMSPQSTLTNNPSLYSALPFDSIKDFTPITLVAETPHFIVVHPSVPAKTVNDLIALAKAKPGYLTFGSAGSGSSLHLTGELFKSMAGTDIVHVPYKGAAPAVADLLGGQVSMMFDTGPSALPHIRSGKTRALAVTTAKRSRLMPDLPTVAESGVPGYDVTDLVRVGGARGNSAGDRDEAQCGSRANPADAGHQGATRESGGRSGRQHARRVRRDHQSGSREVGQRDQNVRRTRRVMPVRKTVDEG